VKRALLLVRPLPHYRRDAFEAGFKRLGYTIVSQLNEPRAGDVMCSWNLTAMERVASRFKAAGGSVVVAENAYLTPAGRTQMYAISRDGHCGSGRFPAPANDASRWGELGVTCKPWREHGGHILVAAQRGIGAKNMASPPNWHKQIAEKLQRATKRPVRVREHPGRHSGSRPLAEDLRGAWAVVVWSSTVGVWALTEGIPVFYAAPHWICSSAAVPLAKADIESPLCSYIERDRALARLAWGQWTHEEIATGEPLRRVLEC